MPVRLAGIRYRAIRRPDCVTPAPALCRGRQDCAGGQDFRRHEESIRPPGPIRISAKRRSAISLRINLSSPGPVRQTPRAESLSTELADSMTFR
jgi:hypothetical protein